MGENNRPGKRCRYSFQSGAGGAESPVVPEEDSDDSSKTVTLNDKPQLTPETTVHSDDDEPFYLMKELPPTALITGESDLLEHFKLKSAYDKLCAQKEQLSAFLPDVLGNIDGDGALDRSSLRRIVENPPLLGYKLLPLTEFQMRGFQLYPGPLPVKYRFMNQEPQIKNQNPKTGDAVTPDSQQSKAECQQKLNDKEEKPREDTEKVLVFLIL